MSSRPLSISRPGLIFGLALPAGLTTGVLMAVSAGIGLAATIALLYAPLIFLNLSIGLILWTPLTFMESLHFPWSGPAVISVLLLAAWLGTMSANRRARGAVLARQRGAATAIVLFALWATVSLLWARNPGRTSEALVEWYVAVAVFFVVATTITSARHVRLMLWAFVFGGVVSVIIGLATTGLTPSPSALVTASQSESRLTGGVGDPNYLAAGVVAGVVLAGALITTTRRAGARWVLAISIVVLIVGEVASESRGGMLAGAGAALAALVLFKRRRLAVGSLLAIVVTVAALWFVAVPGAWHRVTNFNGGGSGRSDLWKVAWRVGTHNPIIGVGLDNFVTEEARFVREPGVLTFVALIADKPHVVHNLYLEAFTETGLVGFMLMIAMMIAILSCGVRAANGFDAHGQTELATLARAVVVAQFSIYVALFFLSDGPDERFWILYGLGAAMLGLVPSVERSRAIEPVYAAA